MKSWLKISLLLCSFGFFREFRPSEPFVTEFLSDETWRNITSEQVNRDIYPIGTYSYLGQLCIVFLVTDILRYKPIIIASALIGLVLWSLLLWTSSIEGLYLVQLCYGFFMAAEVAYYTYLYSKISREKYQKVTGHTRASLLSGRFIASVLAQILVSYDLMDLRQLNYISLGAQLFSLCIALTLPSVGISIYMWSYESSSPVNDSPPTTETFSNSNSIESKEQKPKFSWTRARTLLWDHFIQAYSNKTVLVWSLWWSLAMGGFLQIQSYVQILWKDIDPDQENFFNGAVEAALTLFGAISCLVAGFISSEKFEKFDLWILTVCSLLEGIMIIVSSITSQIWVSYSMYVLFGVVYMFMITLASATVAKNLADDSFALIFGINTLFALVIQTILTVVVISESGFELSPRGQFLVFGSYFVVLAAIFFIGSGLTVLFEVFRYNVLRLYDVGVTKEKYINKIEMNLFDIYFKAILKDNTSTQLLFASIIICVINFCFGWIFGSLVLLTFSGAFVLSTLMQHNDEAKLKVQYLVTSIFSLTFGRIYSNKPETDEGVVEIDKELDVAIESFFNRIITKFISNWYSNITKDEAFIWNIKLEITDTMRNFAIRLKTLDISQLVIEKLFPVIYSHFESLERIIPHDDSSQNAEQVKVFIDNANPIHPAVFDRRSEIEFLRSLSKRLLRVNSSFKNVDCEVIKILVQEIFTSSVLLPLTDVIADPATINFLVILATNQKVQNESKERRAEKNVVLLENFLNRFKINLMNEDCEDKGEQYIDGNFLKDQDKLYSFMQHLKSRNNSDIDILKFYLDVEHLNSELDKPSVVCDPVRLSELQKRSEQLLKFYQDHLFQDDSLSEKPSDLFKSHDHARQVLEAKWRNEFIRSSEYFEFIYGKDIQASNIPEPHDVIDVFGHQQKFSTKLKSVITVRPVEGLEATEIPIWDALDHPLGHSSYYNSVAVKLRKERGQDLDSFTQAFFQSIEQEADIGEDIASTQTTQEEANRYLKQKLNQGNVELYKNLFDLSGKENINDFMRVPNIKSSVDSAIYFLASILNVHKIILRIFLGFLKILPDAEKLIREQIAGLIHSIFGKPVLTRIINELEEKIFDTTPQQTLSNDELTKRKELACDRIKNVNKNLTKILSFLQNPVLNKHLVYCLIDVITADFFSDVDNNGQN